MAWWRGAVGYEVYLRSFADSDGDGLGDLEGVRSRLDHLAWLGVDIVWISPCFPSPQHDHGYDVADYRDIDPRFGTLDEFDGLVTDAHERGLRVLLDLVPNHTSHEHRWFRSARRRRDDPYRDYYVWRDPAPDGGPPNNWVSHFGGPAWTFDETTGQYYLHLFLAEQPDLNWRNPAVADEFDAILRFWFERGVDGFRVDVAHGLLKHPEFPDNPLAHPLPPEGSHPGLVFLAYDHRYDLDQPGVLDVHRRWRAVADEYDALLLGEVYLLDPERVQRYVAGGDGLHVALYLRLAHTRWDGPEIADLLRRGVDLGAESFAYPLSSHDDPRAPTRMGEGDEGRRRALAYTTLLMGLPGTVLLYQGDELALHNVDVGTAATDPVSTRNAGATGRDAVRTPIPWTPDPPMFGFTTAEASWLPLGERDPAESVAAQRDDPGSFLHRHRALLATRHELVDLTGDAPVEWLADGDPVIAYRRGAVVVVANTGGAPTTWGPPEGGWTVRFATEPARDGERVETGVRLEAAEAMILTS